MTYTIYCDFCGKSQHEVRNLIAGPTAFICDECITLSVDILIAKGESLGGHRTMLPGDIGVEA